MAEKSETALKLECLKLAHAMYPDAFSDTVLRLAREIYGWVTTPEAGATSARRGRPDFSAEPRLRSAPAASHPSRPLRMLDGGGARQSRASR